MSPLNFEDYTVEEPRDDDVEVTAVGGLLSRLSIEESNEHRRVILSPGMEERERAFQRAKVFYAEREEFLLSEVRNRDSVIERLCMTRWQELQNRNKEVFRIERELCFMRKALDGYKKALRDIEEQFAKYRTCSQVPEEPTYRNVGHGGVLLTAKEIEQLRNQQKLEEAKKMMTPANRLAFREGNAENKRLTSVAASEKALHIHGRRNAVQAMGDTVTQKLGI